MAYRYPSGDDLNPEDRAEASAVLRAANVGCDEGGHIMRAVHRVLEQVRERARRSAVRTAVKRGTATRRR